MPRGGLEQRTGVAGPFTVSMHKSSLLIAGMYSFLNAGSGSNQSNHMYKLGPIHQGIVERGSKTTSDSYILWPARVGAFQKIEEYYGVKLSEITAEKIIELVELWKSSVIGLDELLYKDARKEFSLTSMTGFGVDGSRKEKEEDFEEVRGAFEQNPFVTAVKEHIETKRALGDELIERMKRIR